MGLYSQSDEDTVILDYFKENPKGYLVSIGENDGKTMSNTRALIEKGWVGTLIEPDEGAYNAMLNNVGMNIICINAAISDVTGEANFNASKDSLLSTLKDELMPRWSKITTFSKTKVWCYSWEDLLAEFEIPEDKIDFISIDAEGMDWIILRQMDLTNLKCLCIEYGQDEKEIVDYCKSFGMKIIYKSGENLIFVK